MTDNVLDAVAGLDLRAMPRQLLLSMQQLLKTSDAQECADVDLKESGLRLQHARAHVQGTGDDALVLQAGTVAFVVDGTCLSTPTQGLRARCSSNGHTLTLLALTNTKGGHTDPGSRTSFHFIREQHAEFVDLQALKLGKRSAGVVLPNNTSHFERRTKQLLVHTAAMQNVGVCVHVPSTRRMHTSLLDVYVSLQQQQERQFECVSIFV